eukprot:COSAG02_NODE_3727_length_6315_cov_20.568694_2_plen_68_part_00
MLKRRDGFPHLGEIGTRRLQYRIMVQYVFPMQTEQKLERKVPWRLISSRNVDENGYSCTCIGTVQLY